jgi:hypothetical protein
LVLPRAGFNPSLGTITMLNKGILTALALVLTSASAMAQDVPEWVSRMRISGLAFGDAYWMANYRDPAIENANGIWLRRAYLTFDYAYDSDFSFRLRFEMNSPGDFTTSAKLVPFVKDLYMRWRRAGHQVYLGISGTPTWGLSESIWGYRNVEKTPLDLLKFGSSRDFGVAARGRLDENGIVRYHVMVGNGASTKSETNQGKKGYAALEIRPGSGLVVQAYADYDDRPDETDRATFQGFAGWQGENARVGVLAARQRREVAGSPTLNLDVVSAFGVVRVNERVALLARYDRTFDPNPDGAKISYLPFDPTAESNFLLGGIDITVHEGFHLIPNVEAIIYSVDTGTAPDTDVAIRTTFSITF